MKIYFNGRALGKPTAGVSRVVGNLIRAVDALLALDGTYAAVDATLLVPISLPLPDWVAQLTKIKVRACGRLSGNLWEQLELPFLAWDGYLVNLANAAPLLARRQVVMVHDANVYRVGRTYSRGFVAWHRAMHVVFRLRRVPILTVSRWSASELADAAGFSPARISVVPNACDHILEGARRDSYDLTRLLECYGVERRRFAVLIGAAAAHKNVDAITDAADGYAAAGIKLLLIGDADRRVFRKTQCGDQAGVVWTGRISDHDLRLLLGSALCLLFPSRYEGFGLPPLEAMALGCPAIVSDIPVMREVCGDSAAYADPDDPATFLREAIRFANDAAHWQYVSDRSRDYALTRFRWEAAAKKLLESLSLL